MHVPPPNLPHLASNTHRASDFRCLILQRSLQDHSFHSTYRQEEQSNQEVGPDSRLQAPTARTETLGATITQVGRGGDPRHVSSLLAWVPLLRSPHRSLSQLEVRQPAPHTLNQLAQGGSL